MKTYTFYCHVCKELKTIELGFLSVRDYKDIDGISYPVFTCGTSRHTAEEIRNSYKARWQETGLFEYGKRIA